MPKTIPSLKRVNISIEGELHELATRHAEKLGLMDGFSGYVSRLCKQELKKKGTKLATVSRLLHGHR